jgi:energy-coupling factor transport system substrate-specific component
MKTADIFRFKGFEILALVLVSATSLMGFFWPFLSSQDRSGTIFWFAGNLSLLLLLSVIGRAKFDPKSLALLAVLSAIIAALRPLGAGAAGIEPMWFLLILASYVFRATFGFLLGAISMLLSAFLTGGFGPWLSYQIFAAAWIGFLAGSIPSLKVPSKFEIPILAVCSMFLAEIFGFLMDLQFWPFALGPKTQLSYLPDAAVVENLERFLVYHATTSMAWNLPRAIFTALLILFVGKGVLNALRRASRKANFATAIYFT